MPVRESGRRGMAGEGQHSSRQRPCSATPQVEALQNQKGYQGFRVTKYGPGEKRSPFLAVLVLQDREPRERAPSASVGMWRSPPDTPPARSSDSPVPPGYIRSGRTGVGHHGMRGQGPRQGEPFERIHAAVRCAPQTGKTDNATHPTHSPGRYGQVMGGACLPRAFTNSRSTWA